MSEPTTPENNSNARLRLVNYGIAFSGLITILVAFVSTQPHGILVFGLGGLAVSVLVFEHTQGGVAGSSLGLLTGSFTVWLWPTIGDGSYVFLGVLLVMVGIVNAVVLPPFYLLGKRLGDR